MVIQGNSVNYSTRRVPIMFLGRLMRKALLEERGTRTDDTDTTELREFKARTDWVGECDWKGRTRWNSLETGSGGEKRHWKYSFQERVLGLIAGNGEERRQFEEELYSENVHWHYCCLFLNSLNINSIVESGFTWSALWWFSFFIFHCAGVVI